MALEKTNLENIFSSLFGEGDLLIPKEGGGFTFDPIPGFPKQTNEGILDYVFRLLNSGNILFNRGAWNDAEEYHPNQLVSFGGKYWVSKTENTNSEPSLENPDWDSLLYTLEGLKGDKGDDGVDSFVLAP
jgi:hypothetical protein